MSLDTDGINPPKEVGNEVQCSKRSERKRQREKQRRSDLTTAFDELASFIVHIEPESDRGHDDSKKKRKKSDGGVDQSGITRLEMVERAHRMMRRLHTENEERKRIIAGIQEEERKRIIAGIQEKGGVPNDNVLVMVPALTPSPEEPYPIARAQYPPYPAYPPPYFHGGHHQQSSSVTDYSAQLSGRSSQPQHYANWGGYHGRAPPVQAMSPSHPPPPYGTSSSQQRPSPGHNSTGYSPGGSPPSSSERPRNKQAV